MKRFVIVAAAFLLLVPALYAQKDTLTEGEQERRDEWRIRKWEKIAFVGLSAAAHLSVERDLRSTERARLALIRAGRTPIELNPLARSSFDNPAELRLKAHAATAALNGVSLLMMRSKRCRGAWPWIQVAIIVGTNVAASRNNRIAQHGGR